MMISSLQVQSPGRHGLAVASSVLIFWTCAACSFIAGGRCSNFLLLHDDLLLFLHLAALSLHRAVLKANVRR
jgi:hypothetical protein